MAGHPDLKQFQREVWALRVKDAWGVHIAHVPYSVHTRLEYELEHASTFDTPEPPERKRQKRTPAPKQKPREYTELELCTGCCTDKSGFRLISNKDSLKTGQVRIKTTRTNTDQITVYTGSVNITHDIEGNLFPVPVSLVTPSVRTTRPRKEVNAGARKYTECVLFEMYIRFVSYTRRSFLWTPPYPGYEIDSELTYNPTGTVVPRDVEGIYERVGSMHSYMNNLIGKWCDQSGIDFIDIGVACETTNSSNVSSEESE